MSEKQTKKQNAITWARISAELVGWPMLIVAVFGYAQKIVFTLTCEAAGYQCQYAFRAASGDAVEDKGNASDKTRKLEIQVNSLNDSMRVLAEHLGLLEEPTKTKKGK